MEQLHFQISTESFELNLYLTFNKQKQKKKTKLPISSKEWRERLDDENFKSWLSNRQRLKNKKKGDPNQ